VAVLVVTGLLASAGVAGAAPADAGARRPQRRPVVRRARPLRRSPGVDVRRDDATVFLDVDAAWRAGPDDVTETATFSAYEEAGRVSATYRAKSRTVPAVSGGVHVWHGLWLGAAFAQSSSSAAAAVSVDVPHPFFFDQPRHAAGESPAARRRETTFEVDALWAVPVQRRVELRVFAGPAVVRLRQDVVSDYSYTDTYPFEMITFDHATLATASAATVGVAAGADLAVYLTSHLGAGFAARYTHATVDLDTPLGSHLPLAIGGARIGGGLRVRF
jgi:hypothetical protein